METATRSERPSSSTIRPLAWLGAAAGRVWSGLLALWGVVAGLAPHVLHHVGPLAGAALLAGAGGRLLFGAIGLAVSVPLLLRLRRRFATWKAPALALGVFAAMFSLSTFVIAPLVTGENGGGGGPVLQQPGGHMGHHGKK